MVTNENRHPKRAYSSLYKGSRAADSSSGCCSVTKTFDETIYKNQKLWVLWDKQFI